MTVRRHSTTALAVVALVACGSCADARPAVDSTSAVPRPSTGPLPLPSTDWKPLAHLQGTLGGGLVDGRPCLWLVRPDSTPVSTLWETGYQVSPDLELLDAEGDIIASPGEAISGGGGILPGGSTLPQCGRAGAGGVVLWGVRTARSTAPAGR